MKNTELTPSNNIDSNKNWEIVEKWAGEHLNVENSASETVINISDKSEAAKAEHLAIARDAVKNVYTQTEFENPAPQVEKTTTSKVDENKLVGIKQRHKVDIIGQALDDYRCSKMEKLVKSLDDDASDDQIDAVAICAKKFLNEYTAESVLFHIRSIGAPLPQRKCLGKLTDSIKREAIEKEMFNSYPRSLDSFYFLVNTPKEVSNRLADIACDDLITKTHDKEMGAKVAKLFRHSREEFKLGWLPEFGDLSDKLRPKMVKILLETRNLDGAVQLMSREEGEQHASEFSQMFIEQGNPGIAALALTEGWSNDIVNAPEELLKLVQQPELNIDSLGCFNDYEAVRTLGPQLAETLLQDDRQCKSEFTTKNTAMLRDFHEKISEQGGGIGADFMKYFADKLDLLNELRSQTEITPELAQNINRAILAEIEVTKIEDFGCIDKFIRKQAKRELSRGWMSNETKARDLVGVALFGIPTSELHSLMASLLIITDNRNMHDRLYGSVNNDERNIQYRFDKLDELVVTGKIKPEQEAQVYLALSLLQCGLNKRKLAKFLNTSKNIERAGELYPLLKELEAIYMKEANANYAAELLTPKRAAEKGCEISATTLTRVGENGETTATEIPVYHLDGQDFSILTHRLGAFSYIDTKQPAEWNTRHGSKYISTSLIGSECIEVVGGVKTLHREESIFYGFSELGKSSILAMSAIDLGTSSIDDKTKNQLSVSGDNTKPSKTARTHRQPYWYLTPTELLQATRDHLAHNEVAGYNYNEVVLDRYSGNASDPGGRLQPSCVMAFGKTVDSISEASKIHADYFSVPIFLIDDTKYHTPNRRMK